MCLLKGAFFSRVKLSLAHKDNWFLEAEHRLSDFCDCRMEW